MSAVRAEESKKHRPQPNSLRQRILSDIIDVNEQLGESKSDDGGENNLAAATSIAENEKEEEEDNGEIVQTDDIALDLLMQVE